MTAAAAAATSSEMPPARTKYQTLAPEGETVRARRNERWTPAAEMSGTAAKASPRSMPEVARPSDSARQSSERAEKSSLGTALTKVPFAEVVTIAACLIPATEATSGRAAAMIREASLSLR